MKPTFFLKYPIFKNVFCTPLFQNFVDKSLSDTLQKLFHYVDNIMKTDLSLISKVLKTKTFIEFFSGSMKREYERKYEQSFPDTIFKFLQFFYIQQISEINDQWPQIF